MKYEGKFTVATDRLGSEIRPGDTVREIEGELRQGTILNIYRNHIFLYNRDIAENSGVFVTRATNLATIIAKGGRVSNDGIDLSRLNPQLAAQRNVPVGLLPRSVGRDKAINQTVRIRKGPYKGLMGIVKDTTDFTARVELHTAQKTVTVDKQNLGFLKTGGPMNTFIPFAEFLVQSRGSLGIQGPSPFEAPDGNLVSWSGRTPQYGSGNQTPRSKAASGLVPAWAQTGNKTPAYGAGNRTPAYGGGNRTPAYGGGNRTPAYGGGNRTPAYGGGNRTPAYGGGNRTPAYGGGNRTPAYGRSSYAGNRTPGGPNDFTTEAPWESHPPDAGFGAPTPRNVGKAESSLNHDTDSVQLRMIRAGMSRLMPKHLHILLHPLKLLVPLKHHTRQQWDTIVA